MVIIFDCIVSTGTVGSGDSVLSVPVGMTVPNVGVPTPVLRFPEPVFGEAFMVHPQAKTSRTRTGITRKDTGIFTGSQLTAWEAGRVQYCGLARNGVEIRVSLDRIGTKSQ
jgi:hypothetical protein